MNDRVADNVVRIPTTLDSNFFRYWFEFLKPFHDLTPRETDIITAYVYKRYELSKVIHDDEILNQVLMNKSTREEIEKDCEISKSFLSVILYSLRRKGLLTKDGINPRFIPNIKEDDKGSFKLMLYFDFTDEL